MDQRSSGGQGGGGGGLEDEELDNIEAAAAAARAEVSAHMAANAPKGAPSISPVPGGSSVLGTVGAAITRRTSSFGMPKAGFREQRGSMMQRPKPLNTSTDTDTDGAAGDKPALPTPLLSPGGNSAHSRTGGPAAPPQAKSPPLPAATGSGEAQPPPSPKKGEAGGAPADRAKTPPLPSL